MAVLDPLLLLEPERLRAAEASPSSGAVAPVVTLRMPHRLLPLLSQGQLELAEGDEPGSHLLFGQRGELFQYSYVGSHLVTSGFSSIVLADELRRAAAAAAGGPPPRKQAQQGGASWAAFLAHFQRGSPWPAPQLPFLFAGRVVDSASAAVHVLKAGGTIVGMQVASEG